MKSFHGLALGVSAPLRQIHFCFHSALSTLHRCEPWCWNIYQHLPFQNHPNVGKYTIHGAYGIFLSTFRSISAPLCSAHLGIVPGRLGAITRIKPQSHSGYLLHKSIVTPKKIEKNVYLTFLSFWFIKIIAIVQTFNISVATSAETQGVPTSPCPNDLQWFGKNGGVAPVFLSNSGKRGYVYRWNIRTIEEFLFPIYIYIYVLVGGVNPLKHMSSSVGNIIPNIWKVKNSCSKPPTSKLLSSTIMIDH